MKTTDDSAARKSDSMASPWIERPRIQNGIMILIVINAIILGLETEAAVMAAYGEILVAVDHAILAVFVVEILLRIYAHRLKFFRDPWSLFDFAVVGIALVPASGPFAVLRALRVLRVLRILTIVPSMRRVVGALLDSRPVCRAARAAGVARTAHPDHRAVDAPGGGRIAGFDPRVELYCAGVDAALLRVRRHRHQAVR
jgi:hypothetical protein